MKKLSFVLLAGFVAGSMLFTSCSEDTPGLGPDISFANDINEVTLTEGVTEYTIAGTITSDVGLESVKYKLVTDAGSTQLDDITSFTDKNNYQFQYTVSNVTADVTIEVEATDKDNVTNSLKFDIIAYVVVAGPIDTWSATLGSFANATGSSFASSTGAVYTLALAKTNSALVDWLYYYGSENEATLAAPNDATVATIGTLNNAPNGISTWATKNATKFKTTSVTAAEFDAIADDADILTAAEGAAETKVNLLTSNSVVAFNTAANKKGLVKIGTITGTADGTIAISVKVQK